MKSVRTNFHDLKRAASRPPLQVVLFWTIFVVAFSPLFADGPADEHFQAGLAYERLGRYDDAYTDLQLAFALDQNNTEIALALGLVACRLGRLDVAQRALERSVALDANSIASYYQLALLYEKKGIRDRAQDAWQRFESLNHDDQLKEVAQRHLQYLETHGT